MSKYIYPNETLVTSPDSEGHQYWANFDARPQGKGARKKSYKGLLQGLGPRKNQKVVVKVFRAHEGTESDCDTEISRHLVVRNIAVHFNRFLHDRSTISSTANSGAASSTTSTTTTPSVTTSVDAAGGVSTVTSSSPGGVSANVRSRAVETVGYPNIAEQFSSQCSVESAGSNTSGGSNAESSGEENLGRVSTEEALASSVEKEQVTSPASPLSPEVEANLPQERKDFFPLPAKDDKSAEIMVDIVGLENNQEDKIFEEVTTLMIPEAISEEKKQDLADLKSQEMRNVPQVVRIIVPAKVTLEVISMASCLPRSGKRKLSVDEWVLLENYLGQPFCSFLNPEGFAVRQGRRKASLPLLTKRVHTVLDAFVHYSYHWSQGSFVVCGLQGVQDSKGYRLTAPVVHSVSGSFGETDKGCEGIKAVMKNHICCSLCEDLGKSSPANA